MPKTTTLATAIISTPPQAQNSRWYTFKDTTLADAGITVTMYIYCRSGGSNGKADVYVDTGSGGSKVGTVAQRIGTSWGPDTITLPGSYTASQINNLRVQFKYTGASDTTYIDYVRIDVSQSGYVTTTSTSVSTASTSYYTTVYTVSSATSTQYYVSTYTTSTRSTQFETTYKKTPSPPETVTITETGEAASITESQTLTATVTKTQVGTVTVTMVGGR